MKPFASSSPSLLNSITNNNATHPHTITRAYSVLSGAFRISGKLRSTHDSANASTAQTPNHRTVAFACPFANLQCMCCILTFVVFAHEMYTGTKRFYAAKKKKQKKGKKAPNRTVSQYLFLAQTFHLTTYFSLHHKHSTHPPHACKVHSSYPP